MLDSRYLRKVLIDDAFQRGKMAFVSGPRQVGKTTLGKSLLQSPDNLFSWDDPVFKRAWSRSPQEALANRGPGAIVIDEIHKDRQWKNRLKGFYDLKGEGLPIVVTGSARLDLYRKGGDSLLGRYLPYRLHPFTVGESETASPPFDGALERIAFEKKARYKWEDLLRLGGFPEPLYAGSERHALRWSRLRRERLVIEDVRDLRAILDLNALKLLVDFLPERVGSLFSINSLREDVGVAYATVRDWVSLLEAVYFCFTIKPYSDRMTRMLKAEPKLYVYDILQLTNPAKRLENLTALHLLKACHFWTDSAYGEFDLSFVRTKEKREVDFLVLKDRKPWMLIECKSGSKSPAPNLMHFARGLRCPLNFQLVVYKGFDRFYPEHKVRVLDYEKFFAEWV